MSKRKEDFITSKWRPMMAVMYMCVCVCDFILFPIGFTIVQFWETQAINDAFRQWQPMTLQGGGLFHMAMGAVLGVTAWSRGQEKLAGVTSSNQPQQYQSSYNQPEYRPQPTQRTTVQTTEVTTGYGGKLAPPQYDHPLI